ncbi:putative permease (RarD protein) [Pseudomonas reidholzensis]|uniref:Putative permease (RarD protein) n=1 Tax=Pseudomonas reidholzensis TaxID=1785162 RepID=A0A383RWA0_9PSED|nr:rarD protein [Pseudomonas reidholzensis]SYX91063.1 putative permease (RarD protein) [Pseudomonas reidholzensis]
MSAKSMSTTAGLSAALASNCLLGLSALYWKALASLPALALLGCRILLSLLCVTLVLALRRELQPLLRGLKFRDVVLHAAAALLVAANWGTFIWASIHGRLLESGLGYLIAPVLGIALGLLVYRERLSRWRAVALALVVLSVLYLFLSASGLDSRVFLVIGFTWGGYAWLKKLAHLSPWSGLFVESLVLGVVLIPLIVWLSAPIQGIAGLTSSEQGLLLLCGLVSLLPLALFSFAARRLPLSVMGLMQFVLPLTQFGLALVVYGQEPNRGALLAFAVIALAMLLVILEPLLAPIFMKKSGDAEDAAHL